MFYASVEYRYVRRKIKDLDSAFKETRFLPLFASKISSKKQHSKVEFVLPSYSNNFKNPTATVFAQYIFINV
ncbi:hypothetical protein EO92_11625 [Methanosarcina sp. 2.H.A.1B.4]|nr:hypothetical protein EO92_11625 [Methanosarcina sp. 2.H.A.1B.4]KKH48335.1 hypothetical protein EO93_13925 [Methanosarcina sp. 1.H.A.2.2]